MLLFHKHDCYLLADSPGKRHKKHKKHKHRKKYCDEEEINAEVDLSMDMTGEDGDEDIDIVSTGQPTIKLKIKIGNELANKKK